MNSIRLTLAPVIMAAILPCLSHAQFPSSDAATTGATPFGAHSTSPFAPATDQIVNNGLGVKILFIGRNEDGKTLTISAELQNVSDEPIYIALVGPEPGAIDASGVTYQLRKIAGLAQCSKLDNESISTCFINRYSYLPGSTFSLLQPSASAIIATTFAADQASVSDFLSLTMNVALAKNERPKDNLRTDHKLENIAIRFPLVALERK